MIDYNNCDFFTSDNVDKQLIIDFDGGQITNNRIYSESFQLTETLCSQNELRFGCAEASVVKLKAKMKRKARALVRWENKKGVDGQKGAKAFIRVFNQKLFENPKENELTWIRWYFPLINTDRSLKVIDQYAQQCIRYVATQTYKKSSYNFKYEDMKQLGYRSLVNAYYKEKE